MADSRSGLRRVVHFANGSGSFRVGPAQLLGDGQSELNISRCASRMSLLSLAVGAFCEAWVDEFGGECWRGSGLGANECANAVGVFVDFCEWVVLEQSRAEGGGK